MANDEFKKILSEAIDETFSSLGESPKQSIIFHLEQTFDLKVIEYSNDPVAFDRALKNIFGPGAFLLETSILNKLNEKVMQVQNECFKDNFFANIQRLNDLWQKNP